MSELNVELLVKEMAKQPKETSWLEFKHNKFDQKMIAEDISALANAAALVERDCAYMIWGVDDVTHEIVGTVVDLNNAKVGNEEFEGWLRRMLSKNADFEFRPGLCEGKKVFVLEIAAARHVPVAFEKTAHIRIGSYTKKLADFPEVEKKLWKKFEIKEFEHDIAIGDLTPSDVLGLIDIGVYFGMTGLPQPAETQSAFKYLIDDSVLRQQDDGRFAITNLGAVLLGRKLGDFKDLRFKYFRVIRHKGTNRSEMMKDRDFTGGYALCYEEAVQYIMAITPSSEPIVGGRRLNETQFPEIAVREFLANCLVHQDFTVKGSSILVEVFDDRIEFTNPGKLLVEPQRIIDTPPKARNETLADMMRRMHLCEEAGSGWDKAVRACESAHLPAPVVERYDEYTKVTLFAGKRFADMTVDERIWACYVHASIMHLDCKRITSSSLRERFGEMGIEAPALSKLLKKVVDRGLIRIFDPNSGNRATSYVPFWA